MAAIVSESHKIIELTKDFWMREIGGFIPKWVKDDALAGLMQNNKQKLPYRSRQYMKYKANRMERFTTRSYKGVKGNKGTKIKAFRGQPIESTQISYVNMTLTGQTINNLRPVAADNQSVTMGFASKDAMKVIGNRQRGYDVVGLNDKNRRLVKLKILKQLDENARRILRKQIVITIGK